MSPPSLSGVRRAVLGNPVRKGDIGVGLGDARPLLGGVHTGRLHERDEGNKEGSREEDWRLHGGDHVKTGRRRAETCSPALFFPLWTFPGLSKVLPKSRTN